MMDTKQEQNRAPCGARPVAIRREATPDFPQRGGFAAAPFCAFKTRSSVLW